jgi:hypothetical protein
VVSVLSVKLRRDLRNRPAQLISAMVLVMFGVALYGAAYDAYRNLDASYQSIFDRYRFADLTLVGGDSTAISRQAIATPGVAAAEVRTVADVPIRLPDGSSLVGHVVGMPADRRPTVDRVKVLTGHYLDPVAPSGVLAEDHLARHAKLHPGSQVQVSRQPSRAPNSRSPSPPAPRTYSTALIALRPGTVMHTFLGPNGDSRPLPPDGVLLGTALRDKLGIAEGDRIPLRLPGAGQATVQATVAGFVDEPLGTYAYASLDQFQALAPTAQPTTVLVRFGPGADHAALQRALSARPGVLAYTDTQALRQTMDNYMNLFYVFVAVMLVFGGLLAFTVLFATMSVNVAERGVEIAALRAAGVARRRLSRLVTTENLLLIAVGILPGLFLGRLATAAFLGAFNSDLLAFHTDIRLATYAWTAAVITAVALLAQLPGLRALAHIDLGRLVRERAT